MVAGDFAKGGIDGEGTHKLIRDGGPSKTAYLTSSVIDLDQFVGKKVKIWGETRAAQPLVALLRRHYPGYRTLFTHMTPTGRETGTALFKERVLRCYLPYDFPFAVERFLDHFKPISNTLLAGTPERADMGADI